MVILSLADDAGTTERERHFQGKHTVVVWFDYTFDCVSYNIQPNKDNYIFVYLSFVFPLNCKHCFELVDGMTGLYILNELGWQRICDDDPIFYGLCE